MDILIVSPFGGIGSTITSYFVSNGHKVIGIGGSHSKERKEQFQISDFVETDYFSIESMDNAFAKIREKHEKIDAFIFLPGGSLFSKAIGEIKIQDFKRVIELNLTSAVVLGQHAFNWMKGTGGGNMVFYGSTTGLKPSKKKMPYAVSKAGLHMLSKSFALEGASYNILSNVIAPGYVMTKRHIEELHSKAKNLGKSYEQMLENLKKKNPLQGLLYPEDLCEMTDKLVKTRKITGEVISIDLGQTSLN